MCGKDAPDYPKEVMREQLALQEDLTDRFLTLGEEQQGWAREQWEQQYSLLKDVLGTQAEITQEQWENAKKDRARYEEKFQPIEDALIEEFQEFDTPERRALESGRSQAAVQQAFDAQRANAEQRLEAYGIDPSQTRSQALDLDARLQVAAQQAAQGNAARNRVEDVGRALRSEAINIGRGLPAQTATAVSQALQGGNSQVGNMNRTVQTGAGTLGTGGSFLGQAGGSIGQSMSGITNMYQGQLMGYDAGGGRFGALGDLAEIGAVGAGIWSGMEEGGSVPDEMGLPGPTDKHPVLLADDEYVVPANVVKRKGTDFFDKLREKADEQDQQENMQKGIPVDRRLLPGGY